jgi:hypothetical protein
MQRNHVSSRMVNRTSRCKCNLLVHRSRAGGMYGDSVDVHLLPYMPMDPLTVDKPRIVRSGYDLKKD